MMNTLNSSQKRKLGKYTKRLSCALIALGLTAAPAFANSSILVPSQHGGFKVGIDALYLRPTGNGLDYATTITSPTSFDLNLARNSTIDPSYDWGVLAEVGYLFPCTGNDITLGYTYLNTNNQDSVTAPPAAGNIPTGAIFIMPLSFFTSNNGIVSFFDSVEGKEELTLNAVDLEAGQRFTTGSYDMRMFAGLRYANINQTITTSAHPFNLPPLEELNTDTSGTQAFHSQFRGIGPRIGVDARYCLSDGFGLDADLSASLLVGTVDSSYNATVTTTGTLPTESNASVRNGSNTRVAPVLEAKLGADYTYIVDRRCKSTLVFEAGYQATNYFNASDKLVVVSTGANTNSVAFDGVYMGVKYYA